MKYKVINSAIKINHKVYNIGDEITLASIPESLTHLLVTVKEPVTQNGACTELRRSAEASKKTKRKNKMEK